MATGIKTSNGSYSNDDLDDLFLPRESTKRADVNWDSNGGVDISNRFEPVGDGTPIANTGLKSGGSDLASLFRDINEALATVTLSGQGVLHSNPGSTATAGIRINTDGTIDEKKGISFTQIDPLTDWIIPNGSAETLYRFRVTNVSGSPFTSSPGTDGSWFDLQSGALLWELSTSGTDEAVSFILEVNYNGGATIDTGSYLLTANSNPL